ncbi:HAD family hydrolase [Gluconacetobacter sacchari]|nr:HAD family phosphatase [Gluconacetobacter sacchari]
MDLVQSKNFSALIFDCDGTLVDTKFFHFFTLRGALHEVGITLRQDWYFSRLGLSRDDLFIEIKKEQDAEFDEESVKETISKTYKQNIHHVKEIELVSSIARKLSGKLPLSVASGGQREIVLRTLAAVGLDSIFDFVVTVEDVTRGKPSPELFLLAASKMGVAPSQCLVLEDSNEGIEAAHRASALSIDIREFV